MNTFGLTDSMACLLDKPERCEQCGSVSRLANGLCMGCLMRASLHREEDDLTETFVSLLATIDVHDSDWRIGNYEILEEIGRGGMGVIYRARQQHSRRIVALKRVLSYHSDSPGTLSRFRREAQAAASLDHPNILPIYEVGESEDGLPFFSMKYAPGGSLLHAEKFLRRETRRCVALMAKVARAVHYAHGQGILHRDLKPGNILLDGRGEPLVSDFGLAKWLDTTSDLTRTLTIFGTPGFIAPEQAKGPAAKLRPAADVYSLGAILFDLFTGRPPFVGEHALAVIHQAAEKPAPRLRTLAPSLDRDLETICARCLEREPAARYQSAAALADDVECWLEGKPIKARRVLPPARIWRWSRRNPKLVATAAACLFLGAASIWFLWQEGWIRQISIATKKLLSPQAAVEQSKLRQALVEYPDVEIEWHDLHLGGHHDSQAAVQEHLYSELATLVGADQKWLREKLPKFAQEVKRDPDAPLYEQANAAYVRTDYAESERLSLKASDDAQKAGAGTGVTDALKLAAWSACKSDSCDRAMDHLREAEKLTDPRRDPKEWTKIQFTIAKVLMALVQWPAAEKRLKELIDFCTRAYGPGDHETLRARRQRAFVLEKLGKPQEAEQEYRELVKIHEQMFGPEHPETIWSHWDLGLSLTWGYGYGDPEASLVQLRHVFKLREKVLGREHPDTLRAQGGLAVSFADSGQYAEAIAQYRELVALDRKVLGPEDKTTLLALQNLGGQLGEIGEFREAEVTLREVVRSREKILGAGHYLTLYWRGNAAIALAAQNKAREAEDEVRDIVKLNDRAVGAERSDWPRDLMGVILDKEGRYAEAEAQIRQALRIAEKAKGAADTPFDSLASRGHLAMTLWYQGKNTEAESVLREFLAMYENMLGPRVHDLGINMRGRFSEENLLLTPLATRTLLANMLRDQQKYAEAETQYKEVIQLEEKVLGAENRDTLNAYYNYAYQLAQQGKRNEAKALAERAAKGAAKVLGSNDPNTREYVKFFEILENGQPITTPYMKFHEIFWVAKQT